jgi:hypothetical protein
MNETTHQKTTPAGGESERAKAESGNTNNLPQSQPVATLELLPLAPEEVTRRMQAMQAGQPAPRPAPRRRYDRDEIKRRLSVPDLLRHYGHEAPRTGTIRCPLPGHKDANPSFSICHDGQGFNCHGCGKSGDVFTLHNYLDGGDGKAAHRDFEECARLAGLSAAAPASAPATTAPDTGKWAKVYRTPEDAAAALAYGMNKRAGERDDPEGWKLAQSWTYHRADGTEAGRVLRFENGQTDPDTGKAAKNIRPLAKVADGWKAGDPPGGFPLYRLPKVSAAPRETPVFICEGEKATEALAGLGLAATTWAHGAEAVARADFSPLAGRAVVLVPDNDESGRKAMAQAARALLALDPPAAPRLLELPDLPPKGDAFEYVQDRTEDKGLAPSAIRAEIEAQAAGLDPYAPEPEADGEPPPPRVDLQKERGLLPIVRQVAEAVKAKGGIFNHGGEIALLIANRTAEPQPTRLEPLSSTGACSELEKFCQFGETFQTEYGERWKPRRLSDAMARQIIQAPEFMQSIPRIERLADYPVPVPLPNGKGFRLSRPGYDEETGTYTNPGIKLEVPPLEDAIGHIRDILNGFCFAEENGDKGNLYQTSAIAYLLTCHCRFMLGNERAPIFYAEGNRPGVGKDYLLKLGPLLATGAEPDTYPPTDTPDETRKRILALCRSGTAFMIVSNVKGHLNDHALEQAATSPFHTDRVLGKSEELSFPNRAVYAISGNGLSASEDMARRWLPIRLTCFDEDIQKRTFPHPDLYGYVRERRPLLLGSLQSMVENWTRKGMPDGSRPMASFTKWAGVVGGILEACGLPNPINQGPTAGAKTEEAEHFAVLLAAVRERRPLVETEAKELREIAAELELFPWLGDLQAERSAATRFGNLLKRMENRRFGGRFVVCNRATTRTKYRVEAE